MDGPAEDSDSTEQRKKQRWQLKWKKMMQKDIRLFMRDYPETFHRRVRRGIPAEHRWQVWKAAVRFEDRCIPNVYPNLRSSESKWAGLIRIDISRTFPECKDFDSGIQQALFRILNAYSNLNPDVGYCQGMNFVAGFLLMVSRDEEETFWMFVCLMEYDGLNGLYRDKFPLLRLYMRAFDQLVEDNIPELREHFQRENVQPAVYLHQWFLTLFINCLPLPTVLIIWDVIVCDGLPVILSITVSLLKVLKNVLLKMGFEEIVKFFKTMKTGDEECDAAMIGQLLIKQSNRIDIPEAMLRSLQLPEDGSKNAVIDEIDIDGFCLSNAGMPEQGRESFEGWFKNLFTKFDEAWEDVKSGLGQQDGPGGTGGVTSVSLPQPESSEFQSPHGSS